MRVAVLGATGHVGRALTGALISRTDWSISAFGRSRPRLDALLADAADPARIAIADIGSFGGERFDLVVNATGAGDPSGLQPDSGELSRVTRHFDDVVTEYLRHNGECRAVAFSSGAAYLSDFERPAGAGEPPSSATGAAAADDTYASTKAASEARHREASDVPIVDLRLFGFFSRFADLGAGFLLSQAMRHLRSHTTLPTDSVDVTRDFEHPLDLAALVVAVASAAPMNRSLDVYGAGPAGKFEILDMLAAEFGLAYEVDPAPRSVPATGRKPMYYSLDRTAARFGYDPAFTTVACVADVTSTLLASWRSGE